ncbi:MAG TPA: hypothetical protein VLM79_08920 [Kofleriaceae bacterium]|nr:hypothetical protein [Kofleriaceae bacterium]
MRTWVETASQPEYHHLCGCILALARAASGRLVGRDAELALPVGRPGLSDGKFTERAGELRTAWGVAEQVVPGGGPLGRLGRLLRTSASFVEPTLLALAAAPQLDRGVARGYARLEREPLTAGLLLDLASTTEASRVALYAALHPDAALRRSGLLAASPDDAASASTRITVAPAVLSVLRCEPVPVPRGVDELAPVPLAGAATRALDALGVAPLRAGELSPLIGSDAQVEALARLLAGADSALVWRLRLDDAAEPDWAALVRDAALANAVCLVSAHAEGAWQRRLRWVVERTMHTAVISAAAASHPGAIVLAQIAARADLAQLRVLADDPVTADLVRALGP